MANQEQLKILKKGVKTWNKWREENPKAKINLSKAKLNERHLANINLSQANLSEAGFWKADLYGANLTEADLSGCELVRANLTGAKLSKANLFSADCVGADLRGADLRGANLDHAILWTTELISALVDATQFKNSIFGDTVIGDIDIGKAQGLRKVRHSSPSMISIDTIRLSRGKISEVFLKGCGLSDWELEQVKLYNPDLSNDEVTKILYRMYDLRATQALQVSPLFVSYSHADREFVDKIGNHLTKKGIRYWRDIHDMKAGPMEKQIDRAIRQNPTLLLVLSKHSLKSDWVEHEVRMARALEKELGREVLCPVALDNKWKKSSWPQRIMEQVTEYNLIDFSKWKDDSKFENEFRKLIDGLELFYKG